MPTKTKKLTTNTAKALAIAAVFESMRHSFQSTAFAECMGGSSSTFNAVISNGSCVADNQSSAAVNATITGTDTSASATPLCTTGQYSLTVATSYNGAVSTSVTAATNINGYSSNPPTSWGSGTGKQSIVPVTYNLTGLTVLPKADAVAGTPGSVTFNNATVVGYDVASSGSSDWGSGDQESVNAAVSAVSVQHYNLAPSLVNSALRDGTTYTVQGRTDTVAAIVLDTTVYDYEADAVGLTYSLNGAVAGTATADGGIGPYAALGSPDTYEQDEAHIFTNVPVGSHTWSIAAVETSGSTTCGTNYAARAAGPASGQFVVQAQTNIEGIVFIDDNKNGVQDAGEAGVPNATVNITDVSGSFTATSQSAGGSVVDGYFTSAVDPGQVTVAVEGSDPDLPASYEVPDPITISVQLGTTGEADVPLITDTLTETGLNVFSFAVLAALMLLMLPASLLAKKIFSPKQ